MTAIELRFPANRYHGTGWGRHVNEGVAEWPPSPYRLLRALYDVWKRKFPQISEAEIRELFTALGSRLPTFRVPKTVVSSHTRSYLSSNTKDASEKSLIFDAFVALAPEEACVLEWDVETSAGQREILGQLLSGLNYLGRSESWVEAQLGGGRSGTSVYCKPVEHSSGAIRSRNNAIVYLACPVSPAEYQGKRPWLDALTYSSGELMKERLSGPPAMRTVPYVLPASAVSSWLPSPRPSGRRQISAVLLQLEAPVLPNVTDSIRVAERVRGRLMRLFEQSGKAVPAVIHGKDGEEKPLKDHSHLFILPRANGGKIDSILLFSKGKEGLSAEVVRTIANIRSLHWLDSAQVMVTGMGRLDDPQLRPRTRTVVSATPFVTVRHWRKGRGTVLDFLKEEIARECRNHGLEEPVEIGKLDKVAGLLPLQFRRNREQEPARPGYAFRLRFRAPVETPFALGYGCHFGLGQFETERD